LPDKKHGRKKGTNMVIEEQKDTLESTESSLEKQEENIQEVTAVESELEEYAENTNDISGIEENSENQQGIGALEQEEGSVYNTEDEIKENSDQNAEVPVIENSDTQVDAPENEAPNKPQNPNAKWYILQAYAGYEGRVEQTINEKLKIVGLEHLVDEIFIPAEDIVRTKDGQKRKVNQKYFPGYVLVRMELTPELWHLLMEINRVSGFIGGTQKKPLPLDDTELEKIRSQISEGSQQKATEDEFLIGQKVTITEGSFGNFSGTIDEINQDRRKLKVLVSIFGRPTPVEVEFDKVKHVLE
jgi:transcriptional antiterminator NusG|tara:strand:+ start:750 stop:1649 length:900 start_codon:yes stop_codon:yes gene_type:complete